ncbi:DUF2802 domain-containing protein [Azonexus sp.]|uniref:DUF2802 domain-containing protein n=1 Tax=Azonexus sp. TaxID=1872668 RepID=UPI0035AFF0A7
MTAHVGMLEIGGISLGLREGVIGLIALLAVYMAFVLLRMRRLHAPPPVAAEPPQAAPVRAAAVAPDEEEAWSAPGLGEEVLRNGLEQEVAMLRDEVDALRGELAALRDDLQHELGQMRAAQTVSPIYGDAMQMAAAGYDPAAIAERCGIARAEAELVVALTKSQER